MGVPYLAVFREVVVVELAKGICIHVLICPTKKITKQIVAQIF